MHQDRLADRLDRIDADRFPLIDNKRRRRQPLLDTGRHRDELAVVHVRILQDGVGRERYPLARIVSTLSLSTGRRHRDDPPGEPPRGKRPIWS